MSARYVLHMSNVDTMNEEGFGPAGHVHVEHEWFDGPVGGVADIDGIPHRFLRRFDLAADDHATDFFIWPITPEDLQLERAHWLIFVAWNRRYEAGEEDVSTHPGNGGRETLWGQLEEALRTGRSRPPADARRARVLMVRMDRDERYAETGPDYALRWRIED